MGFPNWEEFKTDSVRRRQRLQRWNDFGSETIGRLVVDPLDRDEFTARLRRVECGPLGIMRLRSTAASASGGTAGVSGWSSPERDALLVLLHESGSSRFSQNHDHSFISTGDIVIRDLTKPWVHTSRGHLDLLMVKVPFSSLAGKVEDPQQLLEATFPASNPAVAMCCNLIRGAHQTLQSEDYAEMAPTLSGLIVDGLALLYASNTKVAAWRAACKTREAVRRAAINYMMRHLENSELTIAGVAEQLDVSQRHLQRAFLDISETPRRFLLKRRLDHAANLICASSRQSQVGRVTEAAFASGFNDVSHFSRSFLARYGVAPSKYRGTPPVH